MTDSIVTILSTQTSALKGGEGETEVVVIKSNDGFVIANNIELLKSQGYKIIREYAICDFSVSRARKGGVVKTVDGCDVEIICYDLRNSNPSIVGCVKTGRGNLFLLYNDNGVAVNFNHRNYDLKIEIDTFKNDK